MSKLYNPWHCSSLDQCTWIWAVVRVRSRWATELRVERLCFRPEHNCPNLDILTTFPTQQEAEAYIRLSDYPKQPGAY